MDRTAVICRVAKQCDQVGGYEASVSKLFAFRSRAGVCASAYFFIIFLVLWIILLHKLQKTN